MRGLILTALFGLFGVVLGQSPCDVDPTPVFQSGYLDNNYRIVYLLENETLIAVERIIEKESEKEFLQFEAAAKNSFATLQMEVEGGHWITLKVKTKKHLRPSDKDASLSIYRELISGKDGKKTVLIDSKYTWCRDIYHRFKDQTEIKTSLLGYSEEKGPNGERDYEKGVQVMTGNSPNFPARLNIIPDGVNAYYVRSEKTKNITEKEISKKEKSSSPQEVGLVGMYYYSQNPPQLEEAIKYFNLAYELLPADTKEIRDGLDPETFQVLVGNNRLKEKEKIKKSFDQDPLFTITNLLLKEQKIKEGLVLLEQNKNINNTNNLGTSRRVVPVSSTDKIAAPPTPTNKVIIRKRVTPFEESPTNPQQNP